ncbi:MCD, Malonyl-CoA decarboxylase MCD [Acuticoccus sediminis]|uniref:MCD, Malonyl-CoA decarboxylase MCD n=1 Tax=Acuticoccus sediminis TaxID=2184697 RepID=A0A8B2NWD8_9HYPH|nr:malonyl-CoA decarboxylase [Acuticoccus sediminis]RAI03683.1 MCD, Malonyl-CoA decarboxylase MCD [Acuticoccus sediminis]
MRQTSVINDLLSTITDTRIFGERRKPRRTSRADLAQLIESLLTGRGESSSLERAAEFLRAYRDLDSAGRTFVFRTLAADYGPEPERLAAAAQAYLDKPSGTTAKDLQRAAEPRRVEIFRRLNQVTGGTQALVAMRCELVERLGNHPDLAPVDDDLKRLFAAWFNRGFLMLREINWQTSAAILEKIIRYEAVHAITDWNELRRRIDVPDRRLFGFFHPRLGDEPLIFVEVALTTDIPRAIGPILSGNREPIDPQTATTAVFYSISNCQDGLRGISFGSFLIKQVATDLASELPNLKNFVTLSPVPGFAKWLKEEAARPTSAVDDTTRGLLEELADNWINNTAQAKSAEAAFGPLTAHYLLEVKDNNRPRDPVARFHLGNGARLEQINFGGDVSPRGIASAHGMMVNYRYVLSEVEKNHEAFVNEGKIAVAPAVTRLARSVKIAERTPSSAPAQLPPPSATSNEKKEHKSVTEGTRATTA